MPHAAAASLLRRPWFGALLIIAIGVGFLHALLTGSGIVYSVHSDIIAEHVGIKTVGQEAFRTEGLPAFWNPSMNAGAPALANPQSMYLFPFDLLYLVLPLSAATNAVVVLNVLLAGLAMTLLCRRHFGHPAAALFCGVAYMLSHRYLAMIYSGWLPKMGLYALVPLLFWVCDLLLERPSPRRMALGSVVWALALLQGDMQQFYYAAAAAGLYVAARLAAAGPGRRVPVVTRYALVGVIAGLLAAPALWPEIEYVSLSTRTESNAAYELEGSPKPAELRTLADPQDRSADGVVRDEFWENNFYFGIGLLPLWIAALCGRARRRAWLLLFALGLTVLLCFDTLAVRWAYAFLPGFALFRHPSRLLLLGQFLAVLLAGLGMDGLLAPPIGAGPGRARRLIPAAGALGSALTAWLIPVVRDHQAAAPVCLLLALAALALVIPWRGILAGVGALLPAAFLFVAPVLDSAEHLGPLIATKPLSEALPRYAFHDLIDRRHNDGRVLAVGRGPILYDTAAYYGVDLVNGASSMQLRHYIEYFAIMEYGSTASIPTWPVNWVDCSQVRHWDMLRALDVRYVVCDPSRHLNRKRSEKIWEDPAVPLFALYRGLRPTPVAVWKLRDPLGPGYFATSLRPVADADESLRSLAAAQSPTDAYVLGLGPETHPLDFSGGAATLLRRGFNRYEYSVRSRGDNFLILSQIWYPDWRAQLDGHPLALYRTNHALLGCFIPRGSHRLALTMTSPFFDYGLGAAALGALLTAGLFLSGPLRRRVGSGRTKEG